jgi:hypothetical protein
MDTAISLLGKSSFIQTGIHSKTLWISLEAKSFLVCIKEHKSASKGETKPYRKIQLC